MVLRLEHIHDERPGGLRGFDDVRIRGITFAGHLERSGRLPYRDAVFQQNINEFGGRREIRLIGGEDVSARIAHFGIVQNRVVELRRNRRRAQTAGSVGVARRRALRLRPFGFAAASCAARMRLGVTVQ